MPEFTYLVGSDFDPTVVPEGYIWDETAFKELVKATDKAVSNQTIYTYGGAQGDTDVVYENAADLTISNQKYNAGGQVVDTTITANTFNNTGSVTADGAIAFSVQNFSNSGTFNLNSAAVVTLTDAITNTATGTINLNAVSTLQGTEIGNAGTITVVSGQAVINAAITNSGLIDSGMKSLTATGGFSASGIDDELLTDGTGVAGWKMAEGQRGGDFWFGSLTDDYKIAGVADINCDGTADIILADSSDQFAAWMVQNGVVTGTLALK